MELGKEIKMLKYIIWNGEKHEVPSMEILQEWIIDSVCETPDGDMVEHDHPDSWFMLLGLI